MGLLFDGSQLFCYISRGPYIEMEPNAPNDYKFSTIK